ncbi:MAG: 50S ribosomal protein L2 [candidate division TM6 bacterium GW2011_GWF2_28_16]|jgi:large subunit ribosomal protein L2|nr:MAG: 50S ribosomal protein L2 [candidate division TM6 bacterium GW2011_GWF2_28_16]
MAIITRRPITSSLRGQQFLSHKDLTKKRPEKSLLAPLSKTGGRNAYGRITTRHIGGGAKRRYRIVDFNWESREIPGKVVAFEYDPNRNVSIALVVYKNGSKKYILRPDGLNIGDIVFASLKAEAKTGNSLPLRNIPVGFFIHNVELVPSKGAKLARSAGGAIQLLGKEGELAILKMPSGETRTVSVNCWATVGRLSNSEYKNVTLGKAGRTRHRGIRPTVRGMAMNPVDHPHGGGEGRSKSGSHPVTPWGKGCKGTRTRTRKSTAILKRRK